MKQTNGINETKSIEGQAKLSRLTFSMGNPNLNFTSTEERQLLAALAFLPQNFHIIKKGKWKEKDLRVSRCLNLMSVQDKILKQITKKYVLNYSYAIIKRNQHGWLHITLIELLA